MAVVDWFTAIPVFVSLVLLTLGATLLLAGRRRPEDVVLSVFLGLVGVNFLAGFLAWAVPDPTWLRVARVSLALDPIYLLGFVTLYPYRRPSRILLAVFAILTVLAAFSIAGYVFDADRIFVGVQDADAGSPEHLATITSMVVGYLTAWLLSVRGAVRAPTPLLARRARWAALAVGIMVVPRMSLLPLDLGITVSGGLTAESFLQDLASAVAFSGGFLLAGLWSAGRPLDAGLRRVLLLVAVATVGILLGRYALGLVQGQGAMFPLRWLLGASILVYGILAYELVPLRGASDNVVGAIAAAMGALAALLGVLVALGAQGSTYLWPVAVGAALAASVPSGVLARAAARRLVPARTRVDDRERRLELYRAALEAAWAPGAPDEAARKVLERDRRAFGVSFEEARTLEHVVAAEASNPAAQLRLGDEAAAGVVVEAVLGEGAHGRAFLGRRYPDGERVVVKELRVQDLGSKEARHRLLREARALRDLDHPNIVPLLDAQVHRGRYLLLMEYVEGRSLAEVLASGPLGERAACAMFADLLDALETAHRRNVVHRDIKPSNILVRKDGRSLLTDFGVAQLSQPGASPRTTVTNLGALGSFAGTLAYAAPEQLDGASSVQTDIYALGLVLFEALTGKPALPLDGLGLAQAMETVANPRVDLASVPGRWRGLVARAVDPLPGGRFASASEMRRALLALGPCGQRSSVRRATAGRPAGSAPP